MPVCLQSGDILVASMERFCVQSGDSDGHDVGGFCLQDGDSDAADQLPVCLQDGDRFFCSRDGIVPKGARLDWRQQSSRSGPRRQGFVSKMVTGVVWLRSAGDGFCHQGRV